MTEHRCQSCKSPDVYHVCKPRPARTPIRNEDGEIWGYRESPKSSVPYYFCEPCADWHKRSCSDIAAGRAEMIALGREKHMPSVRARVIAAGIVDSCVPDIVRTTGTDDGVDAEIRLRDRIAHAIEHAAGGR